MRIPNTIYFRTRRIPVKREGDKRFCQRWRGEYNKGIIRLASNNPRREQEVTLLHEIIHLCDMSLSEKVVEKLSVNLYEAFTKNKLFR